MKIKHFIFAFIAGIIGGVGAFYGLSEIEKVNNKNQSGQIVENTSNKIDFKNNNTQYSPQLPDINFTQAAELSLSSVVHITTSYNQANYSVYDYLFGNSNPSSYSTISTTGSGVIISADGYIVTNNHVINQSENIKVVLNDKRSYTAQLIGTDKATDLALLKIEENNLPYIKYGNSDDLKIGEWVLAVGNPFNLNATVTAGIVSAKARNINIHKEQYGIESFIQTDAAVNPGNSGGALVNTKGELVGINTAIASKTGSYIGYSFAIPVSIVNKIADDLKAFGEVQRAYLGISMADIDAELAQRKNIKNIQGVYVAKVFAESAAYHAGIQEGDILLSLGNKTINSSSELMEQLSKYRPGDTLSVHVKRANQNLNPSVILQNKYGNTRILKPEMIDYFNASFENLTQAEKNRYRINYGVKVKQVFNGVFKANQIPVGFILLSINNQPVNSPEEIKPIIEQFQNKEVIVEGIHQNGRLRRYRIQINV